MSKETPDNKSTLAELTEEKLKEVVTSGGTLEFDLKRDEVPLRLADPKTGEVREYIMREMDGKQRDTYMTFMGNKTGSRNTVLKNYDNVYSKLLALCIVEKETNKHVPEAEIQSWPTKVQEKLFDAANILNGLGAKKKKEDDEEKND